MTRPGAVKTPAREGFKVILTRIGGWLPVKIGQDIQAAVNYVALGTWMKAHGFVPPARLPDRFAVFDRIVRHVGEPLLYLEFGVHRGDSIRYWSKLLGHPDSQLVGFDSFEGLPETFDARLNYRIGAFDTGGRAPDIDDSRMTFEVGWFDETLPRFVIPGHRKLVIMLDADVYSSTITALRALKDHIVPGTVIYLDELSQLHHEPRAFADFMDESALRFRLLFVERTLNGAAFECV
jgi:hypothetical protein